MAIGFYFDEMVRRAVATQLTEQGYTVVMATDVGMRGKDDDTEHLAYALEHNLVLVTLDKPFAGRTMKRTDHTGLICWTPDVQDIGTMVGALMKFAEEYSIKDVKGQVFWLK